MNLKDNLKASVISLKENDPNFEPLAMEIFQFQAHENPIYKTYLEYLNISPAKISHVEKIPCLPISFFKTKTIITGKIDVQHTFESSGTTGSQNARHHIADLPFYEFLSLKSFERFYGSVTDYHILALLPSYLERNNSSLVYMAKCFIYNSFSPSSGFYLHNTDALLDQLHTLLQNSNRKVLLLGVTFALLDLAKNTEKLAFLKAYTGRVFVMETGGMKGRKREMLREEVHAVLKKAFSQEQIHAEYGMTELLSQAYSRGEGLFEPASSLRILLRDLNDPFSYLPRFNFGKSAKSRKQTGGINAIDLGNIDSCCFIETQDLGTYSDNYQFFKVVGRFDNSDIRGCNLMTIF